METPSEEPSSKAVSERVKEIDTVIKSLEKERECLQETCSHKKYSLINKAQPGFSFMLHRVCDCCGLDLGSPTHEEIKEWCK